MTVIRELRLLVSDVLAYRKWKAQAASACREARRAQILVRASREAAE